jgi:single-strand DNA-binding protein
VVLQGFNGTMTMLDGRAGAGAGAGMQEDSGPYDNGGPSRGASGGGGARKREDAPSFDKELDDEIPF